MLMFLIHLGWYSDGVPVRQMARLLGINHRVAAQAVKTLSRWRLVRTKWLGCEHLISLNQHFYAYESLKRLMIRIDRDTGREYQALARIRTSRLLSKKITEVRKRKKWGRRRICSAEK